MALYKSTELTNKTVKLISKFQSGEVKPISTGIEHLDKVLMGGLLPGTIVGIIARSQHGKSYDLERIQRHLLKTQKDVSLLVVLIVSVGLMYIGFPYTQILVSILMNINW